MSEAKPKQTSLFKRLASQLERGLWRVNADGQWYQGSQAKAVTVPKKRVPVVVLARTFYQEKWQSFAIRSQRELRKILTLQNSAPGVLHFIGHEQDGQRRVLTVELTAEGQKLAEHGYVVLPETLVVAAALNDGFYEVSSAKAAYFLHKQGKEWQTARKSALLRDATTAKLALGAGHSEAVQQVSEAQLQALLIRGVRKLGVAIWQQGWQGSGQTKSFPWQQTLVACGAVVVLYAVLSSGYLMAQRWWLESQLTAMQDDVSVVLEQQSAMQNAQATIETLQQHQANWQAVNNLWRTYRVIEEQNVDLNFLRGDFKSLMLSAVADGALPFIQQLSASPAVVNADFDSPVRASGNQQRFIIKFELAQQLAAEDATDD
ncbi:hypothetical protein [Pseudidiomarina homiensis]|uniref:Uncharacterized protein n=1 Tax=Pseudidiomarina homiensis TaxID=364198 RepID=A0A432Y5Q0_9GAMM|nr:hypothetical protein [Pseudidiomarina homiensis]RUO56267.1 hypothetical protein CWI70_05820 [Pseudidiomarina homiensis]